MLISFQKQTKNHARTMECRPKYSWNSKKRLRHIIDPRSEEMRKLKPVFSNRARQTSLNMMSVYIAEAIREAVPILREAGVSEARREASSLLQYVMDHDRTFIITHPEDLMTAAEQESFRECVTRRAAGEPLQYITGNQDFFGLDFEVTKDVLIPRPETELLVEMALSLVGDSAPYICDVGTGSGCITVALLNEKERAKAVAIDLSINAIQVARRNAARHSVAARTSFLVADCLSALRTGKPIFDLVVSNPPYVDASALNDLQREVRDYEPRVALSPGVDGLTIIRRLLLDSGAFVKTGGHLLLEIGFDQGEIVERSIDRNVWKFLEIRKDLQGIPRILALQKFAS